LAFKSKVRCPTYGVIFNMSPSITREHNMTNSLVLQAPAPPEGHINNLLPLYTQNAAQQPARKAFRSLPQAPERILDAPELLDDYYLNLLDWSSQNVVGSWILLDLGPYACW
jgi:hypothetical protein